MFASLNNHTNLSIGVATLKPKELVDAAKAANHSAIAVTDYNSLAGLWDSYKAAKKANVKLIPGAIFSMVNNAEDPNDLYLQNIGLLAYNAKGYRNLLQISKYGYDNYAVIFKHANPRIAWS